MREPFYRFDIKRLKRSGFQIRIGCAWDSTKAHYRPISLTSFGTLYPETHGTEIEAQATIKNLKDFLTWRRGLLK